MFQFWDILKTKFIALLVGVIAATTPVATVATLTSPGAPPANPITSVTASSQTVSAPSVLYTHTPPADPTPPANNPPATDPTPPVFRPGPPITVKPKPPVYPPYCGCGTMTYHTGYVCADYCMNQN